MSEALSRDTLPLPALATFDAPADWRAIDFISDLHLSDEMPRTFEAWAAHLEATTADAVFILGDLFEIWVGDDARFDGIGRRCVEVLRRAASRRFVAFMVGNRDFLVGDALLGDAGVVALADPTVLQAFGQRVLLTHGDELCLDDVDYQRYRVLVRSPAWQRQFLALPLAQRQAMARQLRDASEQRKEGSTPTDYADLDPIVTGRWLDAAGAEVLVHGHTHRPGSAPFAGPRLRHVLTDWDLDGAHGPARAEVLRLGPGGFERRAPDRAPT